MRAVDGGSGVAESFRPVVAMALAIVVVLMSVGVYLFYGSTPGVRLILVDQRDVTLVDRVYVQVMAVTPPGSGLPPKVEVYRGRVAGGVVFIGLDNEVFRRIVERWAEIDASRHTGGGGKLRAGLAVYVWRTVDGNVERYVGYATYSPSYVLGGGVEDVEVSLTPPLASSRSEPMQEPVWFWETVWYVGPENTTYLPKLTRNGDTYTKVPVLIINNVYEASGTMGGSIDITFTKKSEVRVAVGIGYEVEARARGGDVSGGLSGNIVLWGSSWGEYAFFSESTGHVPPRQGRYVYIVARPITEFSREWVCEGGAAICHPTGWEKVESYIQDVSVNGITIEGGVEEGLPPQEVMDWIYNSSVTYSRQIQIPLTPVENGYLSPGDSLPLGIVFDWLDTCNTGFEMPLGLGALLAKGVAAEFPYMGSVVAGITASFSQATYYVAGGIENLGHTSDGGYNVLEVLYLRMSNFRYRYVTWFNTCYYDVPVAMYIGSM